MSRPVTFLSRWTWGDRGHQNEVVRIFVVDDGGLRARVYDGAKARVADEPIDSYARNPRGGWTIRTTAGETWTTRSPGCSCRVPATLKRATTEEALTGA